MTLNKGTAVVEMLQSLGRRNESALRELSDALPDALAALSAEFGIDPIWQLPSAECLKLHPESSLADCASAAVLSQEPCVGVSPEAPELQAPMRAWLTFANNTTPNEVVDAFAKLPLSSSMSLGSTVLSAADRYAIFWQFGVCGWGSIGWDRMLATLACVLGHQTVVLAAASNDNGLLHQELADFERPGGWQASSNDRKQSSTNDVRRCVALSDVKGAPHKIPPYWVSSRKFVAAPSRVDGQTVEAPSECSLSFGNGGLHTLATDACKLTGQEDSVKASFPTDALRCWAWCNQTMSQSLATLSLMHVDRGADASGDLSKRLEFDPSRPDVFDGPTRVSGCAPQLPENLLPVDANDDLHYSQPRQNSTDTNVSSCSSNLTLLMSVFITEDRRDFPKQNWMRHRFSRYDAFLYTLSSYAALNAIQRVFLYVRLDEEYASRFKELARKVRKLFGQRLITIEPDRISDQAKWREVLPLVSDDDEHLVWFLQNDDHVFTGFDQSVLDEGLSHLCADKSHFRTLYPTHWGEALRLAGKVHAPQRIGDSYVMSRLTQTDSVQISNFAYIRWLLLELDWGGREFERTDDFVRHNRIYQGAAVCKALLYTTNHSVQSFYVPMRELCRKFDGYDPGGSHTITPAPLVLPPSKDSPLLLTPSSMDADILNAAHAVNSASRWLEGNLFELPSEWTRQILSLYRNGTGAWNGTG